LEQAMFGDLLQTVTKRPRRASSEAELTP
jgi:hypothetical protein